MMAQNKMDNATYHVESAGSTLVRVGESADSMTWSVDVDENPTKWFDGETAWSDAQRYANDALTDAWRRDPNGGQLPPQFVF